MTDQENTQIADPDDTHPSRFAKIPFNLSDHPDFLSRIKEEARREVQVYDKLMEHPEKALPVAPSLDDRREKQKRTLRTSFATLVTLLIFNLAALIGFGLVDAFYQQQLTANLLTKFDDPAKLEAFLQEENKQVRKYERCLTEARKGNIKIQECGRMFHDPSSTASTKKDINNNNQNDLTKKQERNVIKLHEGRDYSYLIMIILAGSFSFMLILAAMKFATYSLSERFPRPRVPCTEQDNPYIGVTDEEEAAQIRRRIEVEVEYSDSFQPPENMTDEEVLTHHRKFYRALKSRDLDFIIEVYGQAPTDINARYTHLKQTALHYLTSPGNRKLLNWILSIPGLNPTIKNSSKEWPVDWVIRATQHYTEEFYRTLFDFTEEFMDRESHANLLAAGEESPYTIPAKSKWPTLEAIGNGPKGP